MGGTPPGIDSSPGDELSGAAMVTIWQQHPVGRTSHMISSSASCNAFRFPKPSHLRPSALHGARWPRLPASHFLAANFLEPRLLISWANFLEQREFQVKSNMNWVPEAATCKFYHLLDVDKVYNINLPKGCFVACCGASHGWLILVNDLSNLVLFNLLTSDMILLPPVTDFACVEAVYSTGGNLEHYLFTRFQQIHQPNYLGTWFYQKAVLSCSPSNGGDCTVMIIHRDGDWLSFVRAGERKWKTASVLPASEPDRYIDCAYHNGRFYSMTLHGKVDKWDLDAPDGPANEEIIKFKYRAPILTRHLVSTPWGTSCRSVRFIKGRRVGTQIMSSSRFARLSLDDAKMYR